MARELQPTWLLVENVPGLLSSNGGQDFGIVLDTLGELGYGLAWRVLDARHFGVPQRRRRVFIVGHLGGPCPYEVLFEPEGRAGDPAASRAQGTEVAGTLGGGAPGARRWRGDLDSSGAYIPQVGRNLTKTMHKRHDDADTIVSLRPGHVNANEGGLRVEEIGALDASGAGFAVAHTLRANGFDASEDGTGRGTPMVVDWQSGGDGRGLDPTYEETRALHSGQTPAVFQLSNGEAREQNGTVPTITGHSGLTRHGGRSGTQQPLILRMREGKEGGGKGPLIREGESLTLATANDQTLFTPQTFRKSKRAQTADDDETWVPSDQTNTLNAFDVGDVRATELVAAASVRRLTPTECERLMGWPDGWTCLCGCVPYSTEACKCADGPRYAAIGNGVVANVVEWVGRRIAIELRAVA